jgi:hypothetical protein
VEKAGLLTSIDVHFISFVLKNIYKEKSKLPSQNWKKKGNIKIYNKKNIYEYKVKVTLLRNQQI